MKKNLRVNTAIFDMVHTTPEAVDAYDEIKVNCALCLTSTRSKQLLATKTFGVNTAQLVDVGDDENLKVMSFNGFKVLSANTEPPKEPTIVVVNGGLVIEDCDKKSFDQFKGLYINGVAFHPKSLDTSNFMVNGGMIPYPDGATLLFQGLKLNNSFLRSAVQGSTYFVQGFPSNLNDLNHDSTGKAQQLLKETGIVAVEPLDLELLTNKNIRFDTRWLTVSEDNAEHLLPFVEGYVGVTIIPSGFKIMQGGKLDRLAIRRFGTRIYVDGDLQIHADEADALTAVEQLQVSGKVIVADSLADAFFAKCTQYEDVTVYQGEWIEHVGSDALVDREALEQSEEGTTFHFIDANVEISTDTPVGLLSEKLHRIILRDSSLTLGLGQHKVLNKKIDNHKSDIIIREHIQEVVPKQEPETKAYTETYINTAYFKL